MHDRDPAILALTAIGVAAQVIAVILAATHC